MPSIPPAPDSPASLGRRERKKLATRDRIFDCAIRLFAERGYDATSMEDIGECADVARATVFNYFARKEDIFLEWAVRRRVDAARILADAQQEGADTASRLRLAVSRLLEYYEADPAGGRATVRAWLRAGGPLLPHASDTALLFAETIRFGQDQGDIRPEVDAGAAGHLLLDAYLGIVYRWVADGDGVALPLQDSGMTMLDLALAGISQDPRG